MKYQDDEDATFECALQRIRDEMTVVAMRHVIIGKDTFLFPLEHNQESGTFTVSAYRVRPKKPDFVGKYDIYLPSDEMLAIVKTFVDFSDLPDKQPYFSRIVIDKEFRGKGISQLLFDDAQKEIEKHDLLHIVQFEIPLGLERMKPKYERSGYKPMPLLRQEMPQWLCTGFMYRS
jgi:GNAT superfamily N-acetyltransferase